MVRYGLRARYGIVTQNARQIMYKPYLPSLPLYAGRTNIRANETYGIVFDDLLLLTMLLQVIDSKNQVIILLQF